MKTSEFLQSLQNGGELALVFVPNANFQVPAGYHITEVMNVHVDSVDCAGRPSQFSRTVVQLINGTPKNDGGHMTAAKALKIFGRVSEIRPLLLDEEIFFEWGDGNHATSTYAIDRIRVDGGALLVEMYIPATQCKPAVESARCGVPVPGAAACC